MILAHLQDDYEKMRTRILRRLLADVELLNDALSAAGKTPPRTVVVIDHLERVIEGIQNEIKTLKTTDVKAG